jgi:uridine kinase
VYLVGIAGGSASGKTTFIKRLTDQFKPSELCVISQDHYYKPASEQLRDARGMINFDLPEGIDFKRLHGDLRKLKKGKEVELIEYTFNNPSKFPQTFRLIPAPVLIVEGLFIYNDARLSSMFDLKLYIDAEHDIKLERRIQRDVNERGMDRDMVMYQWTEHVMPAYQKYLEPYKEEVDLVIMNNQQLDNGLTIISHHLERIIKA